MMNNRRGKDRGRRASTPEFKTEALRVMREQRVGREALSDWSRTRCATEFIALVGAPRDGARWRGGPGGAVGPAARADGRRGSPATTARESDAAPRARFLKKNVGEFNWSTQRVK
jgi:hypothetical protein